MVLELERYDSSLTTGSSTTSSETSSFLVAFFEPRLVYFLLFGEVLGVASFLGCLGFGVGDFFLGSGDFIFCYCSSFGAISSACGEASPAVLLGLLSTSVGELAGTGFWGKPFCSFTRYPFCLDRILTSIGSAPNPLQ